MRIQLDLSFRVVFNRICGVSSRICGVSSWVWGVPSRIGGLLSGFEGKISIGALDIFNGGVKNPMVVLKRGNGGIEKIRRGYCVGSMGGTGGMEKGSMVALKKFNGALVRVSAVRVGVLKRVNGGWSASMALVRVNGGIGQGQWEY